MEIIFVDIQMSQLLKMLLEITLNLYLKNMTLKRKMV